MTTPTASDRSLSPTIAVQGHVRRARLAQAAWRQQPVRARLRVVRQLRRLIAAQAELLVVAVGDRHGRTPADTLATEVIPLADACRFLEREAAQLLAPRRLGRRGRPLWLTGVQAEIRREPLGVVLILAPGNYPLFLPGVQLLQALVAGNAVLLKPAPGCTAPVAALSSLLEDAGLPAGLVQLLDEDVASAQAAIAGGVERVVLTGSASSGRAVLADLAPQLTPATLELSGNDAVFVLPGADLDLVADALAFGLRLNGGATCIAPRRVFMPQVHAAALERRIQAQLGQMPPVPVAASTVARLNPLLDQARRAQCRIVGAAQAGGVAAMSPILVADARPELDLLKTDVFAPVLALVPVSDSEQALRFDDMCPYALGASVFGPEQPARRLAARIRAGTVTINDLIAPTADPRLPFGGRTQSGYGVTRGAEGLLELTCLKTTSLRRGRLRPHYQPTTAADQAVFLQYLRAAHGRRWTDRMRACWSLLASLGQRARAERRMVANGGAPSPQSKYRSRRRVEAPAASISIAASSKDGGP
jgi:acyl-CoA reductase-like NAD-dependent aldehyde dehydrogenase